MEVRTAPGPSSDRHHDGTPFSFPLLTSQCAKLNKVLIAWVRSLP